MNVRNKLIDLLARQNLCSAQLERKLTERGFSTDDIHEAIDWATSLHYLNDDQWTKDYIQRQITKGYGFGWIQHKLREKGMDQVRIDQYLGEIKAEVWYDAARYALEKRLKTSLKQTKDYYVRFLSRRGFSHQCIKQCLKEQHEQCRSD